ncbi:unnamed protein product [Prunus armeniaca]
MADCLPSDFWSIGLHLFEDLSIFIFAYILYGSRYRTKAEQLNQSPQERSPKEKELRQNEKNEVENIDESKQTFNINENDFFAIESTDVGIHDAYNEEGGGGVDVHQPRRGRNHNICGIHFMQTKASVLGLAKLATSTTRSRAYHFFLVFLFFLLLLLLLSFIYQR